jgi:hypothetical protein
MSTVADVFRDHWMSCKDRLRQRLPARVFAAACDIVPKVM